MFERPGQGAAIAGEQQLKGVLTGAVDAIMLFGRHRFKQPGAHHRRDRERDQHGDGDRGGQNKGKLVKDAADDAPHEEDGDENRDQRKAHGEDSEADLLRALQGGFHGRHAQFNEAGDVFHHHDRVVDHEAGGDGERHQRKVVEAVPHQVHDAESADQRNTDSHAGNQSPARAAQEGEDDGDDQDDRDDEGPLDVVDRGANRGG